MDAAFERRLIRAYEDALDQPPGERDAWLRTRHGGDPQMLVEIEAMIRGDAAAASLPTEPPEFHSWEDERAPPERIDRYRLAGELGRGGMGIVYLGERDDGLFEQQVAIKLIQRTIFSARALAQFATERRILARLHHAHIAHLLDGGVTPDGDSYIVMEPIDGVPITDHVADAGLPLAGRLVLFRQACDAVEHAHRNFVVHGDIKPSNVVVDERFGVKLLDFGIARLLGQDDGAIEHGAFTPAYASPQRRAGAPLAPADDVFALGILLRNVLAEADGIDADLRAVVDRAAADDAAWRYATVRDLADDLTRWERHHPVTARAVSRRHRAMLYRRRHRTATDAVLIVAALLIVTVATTTSLWLSARRARDAAEARFQQTRHLSNFLINDVTRELAPLAGSDPVRKRIAETAEQSLADLSAVPNAPIGLRMETAQALSTVGEILGNLAIVDGADPRAADRALLRAEGTLRQLARAAPSDPGIALNLVRTLVTRARFLTVSRNRDSAALRLLDDGDRRLGGLAARGVAPAATRAVRWDLDIARASTLDREGRYADNRRLLPPVLARYRGPATPGDAVDALRLDLTYDMLGDALWYGGDYRAALASYRDALTALSAPAIADDVRIVTRRGYVAYLVSSTQASLGDKRGALATIEGGLVAIRQLRAFDSGRNARHMENILVSEHRVDLAALGDFDAAIAEGRHSVALAEAAARLSPSSYSEQREVPVDLRPLAQTLLAAHHWAEACAAADRARTLWGTLAREHPLEGTDASGERAPIVAVLAACTPHLIE